MTDPVPQTLGVCPVCWPEFSVGDAKPGDTCPAGPHESGRHGEYVDERDEDYNPPLVIFVRAEVARTPITDDGITEPEVSQ